MADHLPALDPTTFYRYRKCFKNFSAVTYMNQSLSFHTLILDILTRYSWNGTKRWYVHPRSRILNVTITSTAKNVHLGPIPTYACVTSRGPMTLAKDPTPLIQAM